MQIKTFVILLFATILSGCAVVRNSNLPIEHTVKIVQKDTTPKPTIIFAHGCGGAHKPHPYVKSRMIADWGYNVVVVDSFSKRRAWDVCSDTTSITSAQRNTDLQNAAEWIQQQPWHKGKIGIIGYSHGGSAVLHAVGFRNSKNISAAVAFYPGCSSYIVMQDYRYGYMPVQIHSGTGDQWTPAHRCRKEIHGPDDQPFEFFAYDGAMHSFDMPGPSVMFQGHFLAYDALATALAEGRTQEFFEKHIKNN
jgi:dienelactone hydrolase